MIDNSQNKGYICIYLKQIDNTYVLSEIGFNVESNVTKFYVDYEDGCIYVNWGESDPKDIIGYYDTTANNTGLVNVYDKTKSRIIGRVGEELLYFRKREADYSKGIFGPEEECLAYYTKGGGITPTNNILKDVGLIFGSEIGGAAAFVATAYSFTFKGIFRDYFEMDSITFKEVYKDYLT